MNLDPNGIELPRTYVATESVSYTNYRYCTEKQLIITITILACM